MTEVASAATMPRNERRFSVNFLAVVAAIALSGCDSMRAIDLIATSDIHPKSAQNFRRMDEAERREALEAIDSVLIAEGFFHDLQRGGYLSDPSRKSDDGPRPQPLARAWIEGLFGEQEEQPAGFRVSMFIMGDVPFSGSRALINRMVQRFKARFDDRGYFVTTNARTLEYQWMLSDSHEYRWVIRAKK
jgi:hypothetical protein